MACFVVAPRWVPLLLCLALIEGSGCHSSSSGHVDSGPDRDLTGIRDGGRDRGDASDADLAMTLDAAVGLDLAVDNGISPCIGQPEGVCSTLPGCLFVQCPPDCAGRAPPGMCTDGTYSCTVYSCPPCEGASDEVACRSRGCDWLSCEGGAPSGCFPRGHGCPAPPCGGLDEGRCKTTVGCAAQRCCNTFSYCDAEGARAECPGVFACPDCLAITDEMECRSSAACHPVYQEAQGCTCEGPGCCQEFAGCVPGDRPLCHDPGVECSRPPPVCGGEFTVGFDSYCHEGCVRLDECATPG